MSRVDEFADGMRKNPTPAESRLCQMLDEAKIHYQFQSVVDNKYIPDFVILEGCGDLIVEVDGGYHTTRVQRKKDHKRTKYLRKKAYRVVRFKNEKVFNEPGVVLYEIRKALVAPTRPVNKYSKHAKRAARVKESIAQLKARPPEPPHETVVIERGKSFGEPIKTFDFGTPLELKRMRKHVRGKLMGLIADTVSKVKREDLPVFEGKILDVLNEYQ
jgi:very-short-patch-repair endonuclease